MSTMLIKNQSFREDDKSSFIMYNILQDVIRMPSWSIHLKVGKELNKKLKLDNDLFMFGSLIPNTDKDWEKHRFEAHYYGD